MDEPILETARADSKGQSGCQSSVGSLPPSTSSSSAATESKTLDVSAGSASEPVDCLHRAKQKISRARDSNTQTCRIVSDLADDFVLIAALVAVLIPCWKLIESSQIPVDAMDPVAHGVVWWLVISGVAGALGGRVVRGAGLGIVLDLIVGVVGALIGGWLRHVLGVHLGSGIIAFFITALFGAIILLLILRLFSRGRTGPRS
jgi:uncharacterized membrane protein YeaQ/YmgE (transglycosylase-associated protein family)